MTSKYFDATNTKAFDYFKNLGCTLTKGKKYFYTCCASCGDPVAAKNVVYVSGKPVDNLSGKAFHKLLKDNNLLLKNSK